MVASASRADGVSQTAVVPGLQEPADNRPGKLSIGLGGAKDKGGTLPPVAKQLGPNTANAASVNINFKEIDPALRGEFDEGDPDYLDRLIQIAIMSPDDFEDRVPKIPHDLKIIEDRADQIIRHYQDAKNNGTITSNQFEKIYDKVYGALQNTTAVYVDFLERTNPDPKTLNKPPASLIIKKYAQFLLKERFSDQGANGTIDLSKMNGRRYHDIIEFIHSDLGEGTGTRAQANGPLLKAVMLECKKHMNVNDDHKGYVTNMANAFKSGNKDVNDAIREFEKAAGLSK